jgi:hypothetical protein
MGIGVKESSYEQGKNGFELVHNIHTLLCSTLSPLFYLRYLNSATKKLFLSRRNIGGHSSSSADPSNTAVTTEIIKWPFIIDKMERLVIF